ALSMVLCLVIGANFASDQDKLLDRHFGQEKDQKQWDSRADMNSDGIINGDDLALSVRQQMLDEKHKIRVDNHVLVKFKSMLAQRDIESFLKQNNTGFINELSVSSTGYRRIKVPEGETVESFLSILLKDSKVLRAQPDFICRVSETPNDQYYYLQWHFPLIKAPEAWDLTGGGKNEVVVAILDSGIAYEDYGEYAQAPDLAGTAFAKGYDFINDDNHANDDEGHGTHVSGTVAQTTNNSIGVAGIAYRCKLMPVKVIDETGSGTSYSLAEGLRWAVDNNADVINMSLGFAVGVNPGAIIEDAIRYAYDHNVICVAAAGNDADMPSYHGGISYPAAYDECVAVGAIRYDKSRSYYSNYGSGITCVAPGGDVRVDQNGDGYADGILQQTFSRKNYTNFSYTFAQGTSNATPHVAAAAALFKSRKGGGSDAFFAALADTCIDLGPEGYDPEYGYGMIDVAKIVRKGQGWGADS
ncbi:peptidase S8, partial [bacterium]|nr:peptidase S8 [candidate division CSSED10-310 bacterium]